MKIIRLLGSAFLLSAVYAFAGEAVTSGHWVGTWACSPQLAEPANRPPAPGLADTTLRQIVHVSIGGKKARVRFSNAFGNGPVTFTTAHLATSAGGSAIDAGRDRALAFHGEASVTLLPGTSVISDALDFELAPLSNVAITVHVKAAPSEISAHPGSRTTSFLQTGEAVSAPELPDAVRTDHWYYITGIDVLAENSAGAIAVLGDSITDGRGSTTNGNDRWTDLLARRLQANPATAHVAVLNHGLGGNRLLRDGLGPNALARFDRDVIAQPGVRWLIVFEGVNDLGTAVGARARGEPGATARDIIAAYEQFIVRAHTHGIRVLGATIMAFEGFTSYFRPESEADRQTVNEWIRTSGQFDGVIDFDAVTRDAEKPSHLSAAADGGDHLHPGQPGYKLMADAIDLKWFTK